MSFEQVRFLIESIVLGIVALVVGVTVYLLFKGEK